MNEKLRNIIKRKKDYQLIYEVINTDFFHDEKASVYIVKLCYNANPSRTLDEIYALSQTYTKYEQGQVFTIEEAEEHLIKRLLNRKELDND